MVRLRVFGVLSSHLGGSRHVVELPAGATLGDLLAEIDSRWGDRLPAQLWDRQEKRFRGAMIIHSGGRDLRDPAEPVSDGQEVSILAPMAGG